VDLQGSGFSVAFDPLDGSSIVDTNFTVGTIFGVWPGDKLKGITGRDQARPRPHACCLSTVEGAVRASPGDMLKSITGRDPARPCTHACYVHGGFQAWGMPRSAMSASAAPVGCCTRARQAACLTRCMSAGSLLEPDRGGRGATPGGRGHGHLRPAHSVLHRAQGLPRLPRVPAAGRRQVAAREGDDRDRCALNHTHGQGDAQPGWLFRRRERVRDCSL
jgi:hypothetical protein